MGTRGREIVGLSIDLLIDTLNKAFADEWLAYYQYWIGAKVVKGPTKEAVMAELNLHALDELRHAGLVANRIIQLGGTPLTDPAQWLQLSGCGYMAPNDPFERMILEQNIAGEQCAISTYSKLLDLTRGKDEVTFNMVALILTDEVEHEDDLQNLLEDLDLMLSHR
ncbi:MAG TPA: ferritin-like domain-containing protein [Armatimonadota bacterium]|jgi:bacterioferritin